MKSVDFKTLYGRLGNWPGLLGYYDAEALWNLVSTLKPDDSVVEFAPGHGRAAMLLGTAARNVGSKLYLLDNWQQRDPMLDFWLNRGGKTFGLGHVIVRVADPANIPQPVALMVTAEISIPDLAARQVYFIVSRPTEVIIADAPYRRVRELERGGSLWQSTIA